MIVVSDKTDARYTPEIRCAAGVFCLFFHTILVKNLIIGFAVENQKKRGKVMNDRKKKHDRIDEK